MTPEELHRAVIRAVAFGDWEAEYRLRGRFRSLDRDTADDYLRATAVVCLAHRFGEAAQPDRAGLDQAGTGRAGRVRLDHAELGRFTAELRAAGPMLRPPQNFLEVEAVIRGLCGEPHLIEEVGMRRQREALAFLLRYLTDTEPEIREDFDAVVDRSQALQRHWLVGPPDGLPEAPSLAPERP